VSLSAQLTSEQLKEIIEDEKNTDKSASDIQQHAEDGEEVLDPQYYKLSTEYSAQ